MKELKRASPSKQRDHDKAVKHLHEQMESVKSSIYAETGSWERVFQNPVYRDAERLWREKWQSCPECGSIEVEVINYDTVWCDGDVVCKDCETYVRGYDAG